ncbi:TRAP transporter substrate-binding protein DctP [Thermodesulfobacteriota bacterium]
MGERWAKIGFLTIVLSLTAVQALYADDTVHECKLAVLAPEGTSWSEAGDTIAGDIAERTSGRIHVTWYYGGVLGDEHDAIKKIRIGQIQGGGFTLLGLGLMAPAVKILELPFLFESYEEIDHVLNVMDRSFHALFEEQGLVLLGWVEVGFVQLFSGRPAAGLGGFTRSKCWSWSGEEVAREALEAMGIHGIVPLNIADVFTALQTGTVDAFYGTYYTTTALQWYQFTKSMTNWHFSYTPAAIVVHRRFMDGLPKELHEPFLESWRIHLPRLTRRIREDEAKAFEGLKREGISVIEFEKEELEQIVNSTRKTYNLFTGRYYTQEMLDRLLEAIGEFRSMRERVLPVSSPGGK